MSRIRKCPECHATTGHTSWCVSMGYTFVGPHPDAPAPDTARVDTGAAVEMCCGGTCIRSECEYHDPRRNPPAAPEVDLTECGIAHAEDLRRMGIELPPDIIVGGAAQYKAFPYTITSVNPFTMQTTGVYWRPLAALGLGFMQWAQDMYPAESCKAVREASEIVTYRVEDLRVFFNGVEIKR